MAENTNVSIVGKVRKNTNQSGNSKTVAFADVEVNDVLIRGCSLVDTGEKRFVSYPSGKPFKGKDGKDVYPDVARPVSRATQDQVSQAVSDAFDALPADK